MATRTKFYWHPFHDTLIGDLDGIGFRRRQKNIKTNKPPDEIALRLRLLKEVKGELSAALKEAIGFFGYPAPNLGRPLSRAHSTAIKKLHEKECKRCPWNGKTIFPGRRGRH